MRVKGNTASLVPLLGVEIFLGFSMLDMDSAVLSLIHFAIALGIYGVAVAGIVATMKWDQLARGPEV